MDNLGYISYQDEDRPPAYDTSSNSTTGAATPSTTAATATTITVPVSNNNASLQKASYPPPTQDQPSKHFVADAEGDHEHFTEVIPGRCGILCWKPQWLQRFPTKNWFIIVFLLATIIKGMAGSYFPATITSVEKRLKVNTETIGYIMSGNEISQIMFSLILSYFGGKGHRPRWMAFGVFSSAVAYFLYSSPHLIYGPGNEALSNTVEYYSQFRNDSSTWIDLANATEAKKSLNAALGANEVCKAKQDIDSVELDCGLGDNSVVPLGLIFLSQFVAGIGSVLLYTLAGPFIDDHIKPLQAPVMIAATGAVRQAGPLLGSFVAFFCLRLYVSPSLTPLITKKDERWLGAWWLGTVLFAILMGLVSLLLMLFPRVLRTSSAKNEDSKTEEINLEMNAAKTDLQITVRSQEPKKKEQRVEPIFRPSSKKDLTFVASVWDLMKNKTNTWNNLAIVCFSFAFSGFATYFPKYLETVHKQNSSDAAITTGLSSIFFQVAGLLISGYVISKFRLRARTLQSVNLVVDIVVVLVVFSFSQLVCKQGQVVDTAKMGDVNSFYQNMGWGNVSVPSFPLSSPTGDQFGSSCMSDCNCDARQTTPVCYQEKNLLYYSACHAGCKDYDPVSHLYKNCSCLPSPDIALVPGKCADPQACFKTFVIFVGLIALVRFGSSFGRIGNVLIPYRCVDRSQKSLATGLSFALLSLSAIPSPIMYGKIIDSACLRWGTKCGGKGNCILYDDTKFAFAISTTAAVLALLGFFCDVMVWYHVKDLKLYGETEEESTEEQQDNNNKNKPGP